ncbi:transcriptional regulator [Labrys miyagiensis]|uniref:Transcriptional regulator n=1 Tax=Labrys miyagiensis TaxID=346912 RepID=A0ABQ6CK62_9HYPH|nr:MarR family transcriptional regulator [Labrys miyagiensis]GLS20017.1 transcriptional regulator [Labrys miyagiensis]
MAEFDTKLPEAAADYVLDDQVGFILRQVYQRHAALFAERLGEDLTPMQWAVLAKLAELGTCSQNMLGRLTAMDVATVKGVVERLARRGLIEARPDADDRRRLVLFLSPEGQDLYARLAAVARQVSHLTLEPLDKAERQALLGLLKKLR